MNRKAGSILASLSRNRGDIIDRKQAACRACHVTLKYSDNTASMIDHSRRKHDAWSFDSANDNAKPVHTTAIVSYRDSGTTIAIILRLLFYYCEITRDSSVPSRLGKGQGAKEIGHNLVRKRHKIGHSLECDR